LIDTVRQDARLRLLKSATDGRAALDAIREHAPAVAILDVRMPSLSGPQIAQRIRHDGLQTRILFLSDYREGDLVYAALATGAAGYLSKTASPTEICDAALAIARGESAISPSIGGELVDQIHRRARSDEPNLTEREKEVLTLVVEGLTSREIGERLHLAIPTVKSHTHNIYSKLGVEHRAAAVAEALRQGLAD
jgi:two-component system nitrate/nitrite response regulator NarL